MFFKIHVFQGTSFLRSRFFRVQIFQGLRFQGPGFWRFGSRVRIYVLEIALFRSWNEIYDSGDFLSKKSPSGKMPHQGNVIRKTVRRRNVRFEKLSLPGTVVQGTIRWWNCPPGKCLLEKILSVKCPLGNCPDTRFTGFIYLCSFCYLAMIDCRYIFRTLSQIYDGALLRNWLKAKSCLNLP